MLRARVCFADQSSIVYSISCSNDTGLDIVHCVMWLHVRSLRTKKYDLIFTLIKGNYVMFSDFEVLF